jgi:AraC family transcriptional regulator of adaptative response / DNA-3-methyladenine glycosylase II
MPYDWRGILSFLEPRAIPGVELVRDGAYLRTISLDGSSGEIQVSFDEAAEALSVRIQFPHTRSSSLIVDRVSRMFDVNADPASIADRFRADLAMAPRLAVHPGVRVPGSWDGYELAVRAILGQQVTVKGATTLAGRLVQRYGTRLSEDTDLAYLFPAPEVLGRVRLVGLGMPNARAATIRNLARAVTQGRLAFSNSTNLKTFRERFRELPGIGDWTTQYVAMRALGDPDAFPSSDLGLMRAMSISSARRLEERSNAWRPFRAYAAMLLWGRGV